MLHSLSFVDDPTRILRAVRFEQRFSFQIELRTLELMKEAVPLLERVSGDRMRHELDHILVEERATNMLARLHALGFLAAIHPDLVWDDWFHQRLAQVETCKPPVNWQTNLGQVRPHLRRELIYTLWLLRLSPGQARSIAERLKFSASLAKMIQAALQVWADCQSLPGLSPSAVVSHLEDKPDAALFVVYCACEDAAVRDVLDAYQQRWRFITSHVTGDDLRRRGLAPGPLYRDLLSLLRSAWLDGEVRTSEEENALLERLLERHRPQMNKKDGVP